MIIESPFGFWSHQIVFLKLSKNRGNKVDLSGKLVREKSLRQGLPKDLSLRKIDSVFPDNDAKMLSCSLYFRSQAIE